MRVGSVVERARKGREFGAQFGVAFRPRELMAPPLRCGGPPRRG
jgi:hypothetical protein